MEDIGRVKGYWVGMMLMDDRWAAKEAAFKAGGIHRRLMWKEVEVRYLASGMFLSSSLRFLVGDMSAES
jgi:hypothetical protein